MEKILEIENLKVAFTKGKTTLQAIRGISFSVEKGKVLGIVGESGSGKSVTMKSIMNILPENARITSDKILLEGKDISKYDEREYAKLRGTELSMIFQDPMTALNPLRTIGYHLREVIMRHKHVSKKEANQYAIEMLEKVGIPSPEERLKQYPHEFSGGMRQRVLIAMALSSEPKLLIADEPTTALDVTIQAQILELLQKLQAEEDMSVVMITHDLGVVAGLCQTIIVMYGGLIMEEGTVDEIFYAPKHPYTKALLASIPNPEGQGQARLSPIPGNAPPISSNPKGCPFAPRCPKATDWCFVEEPDEKIFSQTHRAICLNIIGEEADI